jgi:DNA repair exonuclease SbcCD ATPase subunit
LNLGSQLNKEIIDCYSPDFIVKCREYHEEKEALKAVEEQAKFNRKIERVANALRKKQEAVERVKKKEDKAAEKQLAKDLAAANKAAKKTQKKQPISTKAANKARPCGKLPVRSGVMVPVEGEVAGG